MKEKYRFSRNVDVAQHRYWLLRRDFLWPKTIMSTKGRFACLTCFCLCASEKALLPEVARRPGVAAPPPASSIIIMAESMQPDPADTLSSSEIPIDVVRTASEDHYVHPNISDDGQDGKQDTQKPSPASPKKYAKLCTATYLILSSFYCLRKHIENVWISQAAYGELQGFGIGTPPSIGLIHGTMAGQGMVLINRFSAIPRYSIVDLES